MHTAQRGFAAFTQLLDVGQCQSTGANVVAHACAWERRLQGIVGRHLEKEDENLKGQEPEQVHSQFHVHASPSPLLPLECDHSLCTH